MSEHRFDTPGTASLYVEIGSGQLRLTAADTTETTVAVTGDGADRVLVSHDGRQVTVQAPQERLGFLGRTAEVFLDIVVPLGSEVAAKTGNADIAVRGEVGPAQLRSGSGDVTADVLTGPATVETGSGDIAIATARGPLRVKSGSGDVRLDHADDATSVSTGSGDILIGESLGPVAAKTGSGDLRVDAAATDVAMVSGSGDCLIDSVRRGRVRITGASGDVRVGIPVGIPVWTDITTLTGDLRSSLTSSPAPETDDDPSVELRISTVSGDIVLHHS